MGAPDKRGNAGKQGTGGIARRHVAAAAERYICQWIASRAAKAPKVTKTANHFKTFATRASRSLAPQCMHRSRYAGVKQPHLHRRMVKEFMGQKWCDQLMEVTGELEASVLSRSPN
jgi:hypothetical protein